MSKNIMYAKKLLVKVTGHRYTGFTVKMPFINLSFALARDFIYAKEESYECSDLCPIFFRPTTRRIYRRPLRECTDYAMKNNLTLLGTYVDRALSARTADGPDFQRMIADSTKGLFDVILVWKLDRFSRECYDSARNKHVLKKNGVR